MRKIDKFIIALKGMLRSFCNFCNKYQSYIVLITFIIASVLNADSIQAAIILGISGTLITILFMFNTEVEKLNFRLENNIPRRNKRYTRKEGDKIVANSYLYPEILIFVAEIEDYLEQMGYYNNTK